MEPMLVGEFEEENEDIDQLGSRSEVDDEPEVESSASVKKGSKEDGKRIPGQTLLATARLENILQADGAQPCNSKGANANMQLSCQVLPATWPCPKRLLIFFLSQLYVPQCLSAVELTRMEN